MKRSFSLILIALLLFCVGSEQSSGQNRGRLLRIPDSILFLGQAASLPIEFYGQGGEREVSFSVQVPPLLRYVTVEPGTSPTDLVTTVDARFINFGYLGIRVTSDQGLSAGRTLLARVIVYSNVPSPHLSFANIPNPTIVRDDTGSSLPISTSAGVSLGWGIADPSLYIRAASANSDPGQDVEIPFSLFPGLVSAA